MRVLIFLIAISSFVFATVRIAYDRNNIYLEEYLNKTTASIENIKLVPMKSDTTVLYELGQLGNVDLAVTNATVLNGINQNDSNKLSNYTLITPLKSEVIFIAVSKNSSYKSIYDLNNRNINFGIENSALDLFSLTLSSNFNLVFNRYYDDSDIALNNMIRGSGLDAVVFSSNIKSELFQKYKDSIRFLNIPNIQGLRQKSFKKTLIFQEKDLHTVKSDLVLISKKEFIENNPEIANQIINQVSNHISIENMCSTNISIIQSYSYLNQVCQAKRKSKFPNKQVKVLNLIKKINSIEDIEIYLYSLLKNESIGGLNKDTEIKKLNKLVAFFKEEKSLGGAEKLIIKSHANGSLGYKGGKRIFKLLRKKGISRSDMIIKSFNLKNDCKDNEECQYINNKVVFELL